MKVYAVVENLTAKTLALFSDRSTAEEGAELYRRYHDSRFLRLEEVEVDPSMDALRREDDAWDVTVFLTKGHYEVQHRPACNRLFGASDDDAGFGKFTVPFHDCVSTTVLAPDNQTAIRMVRELLAEPHRAAMVDMAKQWTRLQSLTKEQIAETLNRGSL